MRNLGASFARILTGTVALATLCAAVLAWIHLSKPFDPDQEPALVVPAAVGVQVPASRGGLVTVLTYHAVSDNSAALTTVSRTLFAEHLATLHSSGYRTVRLADVQKLVNGQPVDLPPRALLLTFDGGSITDWVTVDPMLERYGYTAVAFLTTGRIVRAGTPSPYLSTRQITRLRDTGRWDFGSRSHAADVPTAIPGNIRPPLANRILHEGRQETLDQWRARVRADLATTQGFFKQVLGRPADTFAYPYGDFGDRANDPAITLELPMLLAEAGFRYGFAGEAVPTRHVDALDATSDRLRLPRIGLRASTSTARLLDWINRGVPAPLRTDLADLDWEVASADPSLVTTTPTTCQVNAQEVTVIGKVDGLCEDPEINTTGWRNYALTTRVHADANCLATVQVRTGIGASHHGQVEVAIGTSSMSIRQRVLDEPEQLLAGGRIPPSVSRQLHITVRGNAISASVDGASPIRAAIDRRLASGGVALGLQGGGACAVTFSTPRLAPLPSR